MTAADLLRQYRAAHPVAPILASRREAIVRVAMQMGVPPALIEQEADNG